MLDIAKVPEQQRLIDNACSLEGSVSSAADPTGSRPLVVVLARQTGDDPTLRSAWQIADHFALEQAGRWKFWSNPGTYGLVAFEDANANLKYDPGEPYLRLETDQLITCKTGEAHKEIALSIPAEGRPREEGGIDVTALQGRHAGQQMEASLGEVTAAGEITTLDDPRFTDEVGVIGLWRPFDFLFEYRPGI